MSANAWATAPFSASSRPDADAYDHEPELVVETVGKDTSKIVLNDCIENRENGHHRTNRDEDLGAGEAARQRVDGHLGGEGRQHDRPGDGRFWIRVLQPIVQQRESALDSKSKKDACRGRSAQAELTKRDQTCLSIVQKNANEKQHSGADLYDDVPHACAIRTFRASCPDKKDGCDRDPLPENEERNEIAGKHGTERTTCIDQSRYLLDRIALMQRVDSDNESSDKKHIAEEKTELVHSDSGQRQAKQFEASELTNR